MTCKTISHRGNIGWVRGLNGSQAIGFEFEEIEGAVRRQRMLSVPVPLIMQLADTIRATGQETEGVGHAVWHLENPERDLPCDQCVPITATPAAKIALWMRIARDLAYALKAHLQTKGSHDALDETLVETIGRFLWRVSNSDPVWP